MTLTLSSTLATLNAALNAGSGTCAALAVLAIRRGDRARHRKLMLSGLFCSAAFLVSYVTRACLAGFTRYPGAGWSRSVYFTILGTHTPLAALIVPLVLRTLWLATMERFPEHRRLSRIVFPLWMYVSVTGVLIWLMLYVLPASAAAESAS